MTAAATVVIAWFTATIFGINKSQLAHSHQIERAYVSGGASIQWEQTGHWSAPAHAGGPIKQILNPRWLVITVDNHGKTPAKVGNIAASVCGESELPKPSELEADYLRSMRLVDLNVAPETTGLQTRLLFDFTEAAGKIVYGRFYYTDIYRAPHSSGFILKVMPGGDTVPFDAAPEYTAWD
jgi:hypothetical protein